MRRAARVGIVWGVQRKPYIMLIASASSACRALVPPLQAANFEVDVFQSGHDATRTITGIPPDCIVLDLDLPDFKDLELFTWLRHNQPGIPVIIVTGKEREHLRAHAMAHGCRDFFSGEIAEEHFVHTVQRVIWQRGHPHDPFLPGGFNGLRLS
jgi:DNA-binding response OmpR family regulator